MLEVKCNKTDFIGVYDSVWDKDECKQLRDYIDLLEERNTLTDEGGSNKHQIEHYTTNLAWQYDLPAWHWIASQVSPRIMTCVKHYMDSFSVLNECKFGFPDLKVKKIPPGGGYHKWHFEDCGLQTATRYLAVQIYLNDNFEGGETEFLYFNKRVESKEGQLAIFPCAFTHTHRGNPPIGGTKYLLTLWGYIQSAGDY